jgi:hypothetical protein
MGTIFETNKNDDTVTCTEQTLYLADNINNYPVVKGWCRVSYPMFLLTFYDKIHIIKSCIHSQ